MPSSLASNQRSKAAKGRYRNGKIVPDFLAELTVQAANFGSANTGVCIFVVPSGMRAAFLGGSEVHTAAGNNPLRIQVIRAASTAAPGAAAGANIEDMTAAIPTNGAANTVQNFDTNNVSTYPSAPYAYTLEAGDRVCIAASSAVTSLANSFFQLRFVWI